MFVAEMRSANLKQHVAAIQDYDKAIELDPKYAETHF